VRSFGGGHSWSIFLQFAVIFFLTLTFTGCGEDDKQTEGGSIRIASISFPDHLDPALSITEAGWQTLVQTHPGLLVFPHESGDAGAQPQPGLARAMPNVSDDGRTYRLRLRDGLRFSDGSPLHASDFKASIERVLAMDSPGAALGYTNIKGAEQFMRRKTGEVEGIQADDRTGDIEIQLVEPRGVFTYELAIPFAGVVPKGTPRQTQTKAPPPGAGAYVISDVRAGRSYTLVRNRRFSPGLDGTAVDAGSPDRITVNVVASDANATTRVARNQMDFMIDDPPADRARELRAKYEDRFRQFPTNSIFFFFLNAEAPPFDKIEVRRAVNHAIDPDALTRVYGGTVAPWHGVLPAGVPGYEEQADPYPHDVALARRLVAQAGAQGDSVTVWGTAEQPDRSAVEYYAEVLEDLGFDVKTRFVPFETYAATVGDRSLKAQTGWFNWAQNYPHPADFIDNLLNPGNVVETGNINLSYNTKDRGLARRIDAVAREQDLTDDVLSRWRDLEREVQEKAYLAVYGTQRQTTFFSDRMDFEDCRGDEWPVANHDWARFCLK
jgi:peptide/nickel transport system substrate-binding protein